MPVFDDIQTLVGLPYDKAEHNKDILDMLVLRRARERGLRLPTSSPPDVWNYFGAYVFTPRAGITQNVMYLDLASLYPNLMRALNIGPDTIVGTQAELEASEWTEDDCVWSYIDTRDVYHLDDDESWREFTDGEYKMVYDPNASGSKMKWRGDPEYSRCYYLKPEIKEGFLRAIVQDLIDLKYQYEGGLYQAVKRIVNSLYGYVSYLTPRTSSRLADWRLGESITLAGRKVVKYTAHQSVEMLQSKTGCGDDEVYIALGDTDGCGLAWGSAPTRSVMSEHVNEIVTWLNNEGYERFMDETFNIGGEHWMEVENESYAPALFVPRDESVKDPTVGTKKRYAQWLTIKDGEEVDTLKFTGLEAVRSDVADITQDAQKEVLEHLLQNDFNAAWGWISTYLRELHESILDGGVDLDRICKRGGIQKPLEEYGSASRTPQPIYRGAKYADAVIDGEDISAGSKPMVCYVKRVGDDLPATYEAETAEDGKPVDAIALENPYNLPADVEIDYEKHAQKTLVEPLTPILHTINKTWDDVLYSHEQTSFEAYI